MYKHFGNPKGNVQHNLCKIILSKNRYEKDKIQIQNIAGECMWDKGNIIKNQIWKIGIQNKWKWDKDKGQRVNSRGDRIKNDPLWSTVRKYVLQIQLEITVIKIQLEKYSRKKSVVKSNDLIPSTVRLTLTATPSCLESRRRALGQFLQANWPHIYVSNGEHFRLHINLSAGRRSRYC